MQTLYKVWERTAFTGKIHLHPPQTHIHGRETVAPSLPLENSRAGKACPSPQSGLQATGAGNSGHWLLRAVSRATPWPHAPSLGRTDVANEANSEWPPEPCNSLQTPKAEPKSRATEHLIVRQRKIAVFAYSDLRRFKRENISCEILM